MRVRKRSQTRSIWRSAKPLLRKEQATTWKHCTDQCRLELRTEMYVLRLLKQANYEFMNVLWPYVWNKTPFPSSFMFFIQCRAQISLNGLGCVPFLYPQSISVPDLHCARQLLYKLWEVTRGQWYSRSCNWLIQADKTVDCAPSLNLPEYV